MTRQDFLFSLIAVPALPQIAESLAEEELMPTILSDTHISDFFDECGIEIKTDYQFTDVFDAAEWNDLVKSGDIVCIPGFQGIRPETGTAKQANVKDVAKGMADIWDKILTKTEKELS